MILSLLLFVLSILFYSISQLHIQGKLTWGKNNTGYWGVASWIRKYKPDTATSYNPIPRFLGSTTIFVMFTDGYHLMQFLFFKTLFTAISLQAPNFWPYFAILCIGQSVVMNLTFKLLSK